MKTNQTLCIFDPQMLIIDEVEQSIIFLSEMTGTI